MASFFQSYKGPCYFLYNYRGPSKPTRRSISIPYTARSSQQTRFRFWQYGYYSAGISAWAIDDLFIGEYTIKNVTELTETCVACESV